MKTKKILKGISIVLATLVLLLILTVLFWLGPTVEAIAEGIGSKALGTPVSIESLSINPSKGTVDLTALTINTHEGFNRTNTWALANLHISINMGSLFSRAIVVHEIRIDSPHLTYEQSRATDNITALIESLQTFAGTNTDAPEKKPAEEQRPSDKPPKRVIIESLVVNDVQIHIANTEDPQLDIQLTLEQFSLSLTNGVVQLKNLSLSNPGRLATPNIFELEAINIRLDPESIYSETVVIEDVQVIKPHAFLEQNADTDTVAEFMKIAGSFPTKTNAPAATNPTVTPAETTPAAAVPAPPPPVELHNLYVDDIQVKLLDTTGAHAVSETQTLATIGGISVKLVEGRLQIQSITIPNPGGFTATNLFHLANIDIAIDPATLFSPQVVIKEVLVNSPKINLEQTETTGNVTELQKMLEGFIPPSPATPATPTKPAATAATEEPAQPLPMSEQPVVLETLLVTNLAVNVILPIETNTTVMGTVGNLNPLDKVSLGSLNPMKLMHDDDTNGMEKTEVEEDGPITVMAFNLLRVEPLAGRISIDQLRIGNPRGFANPNLASIKQLQVGIDPDSMQSDTLLITNILIKTPRIAYERKLATDNIKALHASIEGAIARREGSEAKPKSAPAPEADEATSEDPAQKVIIEHLLVTGGIVKAKLSALPSAPIPLPNIEMKDIGKEEGGATIGDAFSKVYDSLYDAIIGSVASVTGFAGDILKGAGALSLDALDTMTGDATKGLQEDLGLGKDTEEKTDSAKASGEEKKTRRRLRRPGRHF